MLQREGLPGEGFLEDVATASARVLCIYKQRPHARLSQHERKLMGAVRRVYVDQDQAVARTGQLH